MGTTAGCTFPRGERGTRRGHVDEERARARRRHDSISPFTAEIHPLDIDRLAERFDIAGNDWLISSAEEKWMMATPDGLSPDHGTIVEVKTTGRDWGSYDWVPVYYKRQVQWQLFVTGAEECVFAWMLREKAPDGSFVPAWVGPKYVTVKRQQRMIDQCIETAHKLYANLPSVSA